MAKNARKILIFEISTFTSVFSVPFESKKDKLIRRIIEIQYSNLRVLCVRKDLNTKNTKEGFNGQILLLLASAFLSFRNTKDTKEKS